MWCSIVQFRLTFNLTKLKISGLPYKNYIRYWKIYITTRRETMEGFVARAEEDKSNRSWRKGWRWKRSPVCYLGPEWVDACVADGHQGVVDVLGVGVLCEGDHWAATRAIRRKHTTREKEINTHKTKRTKLKWNRKLWIQREKIAKQTKVKTFQLHTVFLSWLLNQTRAQTIQQSTLWCR